MGQEGQVSHGFSKEIIMGLLSKIARRKMDEKVAPYASDKETLEVGAYGRPSYGRYFPNKVGLDIRNGPGVDVVSSVYGLPFDDSSFDIVLCMVVLEHLEDPKKAIAEMLRVLRPGGKILISVPFLFPIHDSPNDFWRFTKYGLRVLFKDWNIVELSAETNFNETFAVLLQRVGYQTKFYANPIFKVCIFSLAWILARIPTMTKNIYGNIEKSVLEPEAFTSSFFLVACKKK
ncbi:MAG: Methyltransferase type 11 [Parcubacteria group bacterium GW2011_GWC1_38_6]|nr:MAG: Methyltransferase type 11 [Parcubacteria group bacterium GW2011_GWC1_38_6]